MTTAKAGLGWAFPGRPADGRFRLLGGDEKIRQSIWIILSTAPGERLMRPNFGCGLKELVFEPNTAALRGGLVPQRVREALTRWEPRIDVIDISVDTPEEMGNCLDIRIDYRVRSNNAFYNLIYPFFLLEGPTYDR